MLIIGAGGHAIEILIDVIDNYKSIAFFDNINDYKGRKKFGLYPILKSDNEVIEFFYLENEYCLGLGNPFIRFKMYKHFEKLGGKLTSSISEKATIGKYNDLDNGLNIMAGSIITNSVKIGLGSIIHCHASVHHNVIIGSFCELSPGVRILGGVLIEDFVSIGANAVILPNVKICEGTIVAAGAVVTKDIKIKSMVAGIPAIIKKIL